MPNKNDTPVLEPVHADERGATPGNGNHAEPPAERTRRPRPLLWAGLLLVALVAVFFGVRYWSFASTHVGTDDAYVTSDVVQIAPQVNGTITQVGVSENQHVEKGQLLAVLDDATYRARVAQAQADLDAALAQARSAGVSVNITSQTGTAQTMQAQGQVAQAESGISSAQQDVARAGAAVSTASAQASSARANIDTAQAAVTAAAANQGRAVAALKSAQAQVENARASVKSAQAGVGAAQAAYDKAARDYKRYQGLAAEGAVSQQMADNARTALDSAQSALDAAHQQVVSAQAGLAARQSDVEAARQQVDAANAAIGQAKAQVSASKDQAAAAQAGVTQAQAQHRAAEQGVRAAEARREQALGQLHSAQTAPSQVKVSQGAAAQARAKVEQAKAALDQARLQLSYTRIFAPVSGRIGKKAVEVGQLVQPGTPLMAIVPDNDMWVEANFKETQMDGVHPGSPAEVEVDALPGYTFHGKVESISAATGSTFALLPPDNASGNFTKVVQRIPVKIELDPNQKGLNQLGAGMSVNATVTTK